MKDLFGSKDTPQQEGGGRRELPVDVVFVARTSDRGGAVPKVIESRDGVAFMFTSGMYVVGGDGTKITKDLYGVHTFFKAYLRPNYREQGGPQTQEEFNTLSGRLVGFIKTVLAPGIEDQEERWSVAYDKLLAYANVLNEETDPSLHLSPTMFIRTNVDGTEFQDNAEYMARVFALYLTKNPSFALIDNRIDKGKNGDRNDVVVKAYRDATTESAKKAGLTMFPDSDGAVFELPTTAETPSAEDVTTF